MSETELELARVEAERDELRRTVRQAVEMTEGVLTALTVAFSAEEIRASLTIREAFDETSARLDGLRSRMRDMPSLYGVRS